MLNNSCFPSLSSFSSVASPSLSQPGLRLISGLALPFPRLQPADCNPKVPRYDPQSCPSPIQKKNKNKKIKKSSPYVKKANNKVKKKKKKEIP